MLWREESKGSRLVNWPAKPAASSRTAFCTVGLVLRYLTRRHSVRQAAAELQQARFPPYYKEETSVQFSLTHHTNDLCSFIELRSVCSLMPERSKRWRHNVLYNSFRDIDTNAIYFDCHTHIVVCNSRSRVSNVHFEETVQYRDKNPDALPMIPRRHG